MASRRRQEGGKKPNAEGMHGDRTHEALQQQLRYGLPEPVDPDLRTGNAGAPEEPASLKAHVPHPDGKHRLSEDRQQHDEADKNSEKNRAARETDHTSGENK
jgi:hypothetical protein